VLAENAELLDEMADQIRASFAAVTSVDVQVEPRMVAAPTPPCVDMYPGDVSRGTEAAAFGSNGEFLFTVRARVAMNDDVAQQDLLLAFMDDNNPLSIAGALVTDPTLNGLADSLDCVDPTGYTIYPFGGDQLLGFQFTCRVIRADS
jgi:acyl-CoA thioesterase